MDITSKVLLNYNGQNQQNPRTAFTNGEQTTYQRRRNRARKIN